MSTPRKKMKQKTIILITLLIITTLTHQSTHANAPNSKTIIYVDDDGSANYTTIQAAINAAKPNDTIYVYPGFYQENIQINKTLTIQGENNSTTIIDGNQTQDTIHISADSVTLTGFTIQQSGPSGRDAGIQITASSTTITHNIIQNNTIGIFSHNTHNNTISQNVIQSNKDYGINLYFSDSHTIHNNTIFQNRWGIMLIQSNLSIIQNNLIDSNKLSGIWLGRRSSKNTLHHNIITNQSQYSIYLLVLCNENIISNNYLSSIKLEAYKFGAFELSCHYTQIYQNTFVNHTGYNIELYKSRFTTIINNTFLSKQDTAYFADCTNTVWNQNYWGSTRTFPKIIIGKKGRLPWINVDWHPAKSPQKQEPFNNNLYQKLSPSTSQRKKIVDQITTFPPSFSYTDINSTDFTTEVKNQGPSPTCEAYGLCAAAETMIQYIVGYPFSCDLSEAHLFFYSGGTTMWGVDLNDAAEYFKTHGVPDEGCFPDPHRPYNFPFESIAGWENRSVRITEWGWVDNDIDSIKHALITHGPLVICQLTRKDLDTYSGGVYMPTLSSKIQRGHVVTIMGYNDTDRCWIVKNSAGTKFGEDGYFRISYDAFQPLYSFICPFYGGTGIMYIKDVQGNFIPDTPNVYFETPGISHTYLFGTSFSTVLKNIGNIQSLIPLMQQVPVIHRGAARIFGKLVAQVNVTNADMVEFYCDDVLQEVDDTYPFEWEIDGGFGSHTIEVIAYNEHGLSKDIRDIYIFI